jgi:hypothetical protein
MIASLARRAYAVLPAAAVFVVAAAGSMALLRGRAAHEAPRAGATRPAATRGLADQTERQLVLVYIGRESCVWCRRPELKKAVDSLRILLRATATREHVALYQQGIGLDSASADGAGHLTAIGGFDELSVGGGWLNTAVTRFVRGDLAGPPATPQLIVYVRTVRHPGPVNGALPTVDDERLLARKVGLPEILAWVEAGGALALRRDAAAAPALTPLGPGAPRD